MRFAFEHEEQYQRVCFFSISLFYFLYSTFLLLVPSFLSAIATCCDGDLVALVLVVADVAVAAVEAKAKTKKCQYPRRDNTF